MKTTKPSNPLDGYRTQSMGKPFAPSPFSAGLFLIGSGIRLIAEVLFRPLKQRFYRLQLRLVIFWLGHYNYTQKMASVAWAATGICALIGITSLIFIYLMFQL